MPASADWPVTKLENIAAEITVGHVGPMTAEYVPFGVPFLRSQNVKRFGLELRDVVHINEAFHDRLRKSALRPGDVVIVRTGDPGAAAVIPESLPVANCADLVIVRPGPALDSRFLMYYINAAAHRHIYAHTVGAVQQHFNVGSAKKLELRVPPLLEQRTIADVLGVLDAKIESNTNKNRLMEVMARSIFRSWFLDFDPVVARAEGRQPLGVSSDLAALVPGAFVSTEFGPIPQGWSLGTAADLARYVNGRNFTNGASGSGRMVIRIAELNSGPGPSTVYSEVSAAPENTAYPGDLLFSWSGSLGVYRWSRDEALINQHIFKVVCDALPQWFVHQHLLEALPYFQGVAADKATTMGHIKREHLRLAMMAMPPASILDVASRVITPVYQAMLANECQSFELAAVRDALLPRLLSGEATVGLAEKLVEHAV